VKLLDLNLLVYASDEETVHHETAAQWLSATLSGSETVAFAWFALVGFVRITTRRRGTRRPWAIDQALDIVDEWLAQPVSTVVHPTDRHAAVLRDLLVPLGVGGNVTSDAHLAALAVEHGATLCSADTDFARFTGLNWLNPLAA